MTVQNNVGTVLLCCAENGCWAFIPFNITLTSARCYNFTTPSSMGKYRIIAHFTLLIDDYSPLGGPPDPSEWFPPSGSPWDLSEWVSPWEVSQTPQNDFSNGKSEWFFHWEVPQTPQNTGGDAPLNNYTPTPSHSRALFHLTYSCLHDVFLIHLYIF